MQNWRRIHRTYAHQEVKKFSSKFFGTLSIHIPTIFLLLVIVGSLVDVFQEGGWRMSAECAHFIWGVCTNRTTNKLHVQPTNTLIYDLRNFTNIHSQTKPPSANHLHFWWSLYPELHLGGFGVFWKTHQTLEPKCTVGGGTSHQTKPLHYGTFSGPFLVLCLLTSAS